MGKRIPTVYYSLTKEIGTYTVCSLALEELKLMLLCVLMGAKNKQVIKISINNFITLEASSISTVISMH